MNKKEFLKLWDKMFKSKHVEENFIQSVFGRHDKVGDGWRTLTAKRKNAEIEITLERQPGAYLIYNETYRFGLGKIEGEKMCIAFDKRGVSEMPIKEFNELLNTK